MHVNLKNVDFESFVDFLFDHPVADRNKNEEPWYWAIDLRIEYNPIEILKHCIQLFSEPNFLLNKFSQEHLSQGFDAIRGSNIDCSVTEIIFDLNVTFACKHECINSMYYLYQKMFSKNILKASSFMWWDSIAYGYCCDVHSPENNEQERLIQDTMFATLCKILALESFDCQLAALHGLGHLRHPETESVINSYLKSHPDLDEETKEYARDCITGDIM